MLQLHNRTTKEPQRLRWKDYAMQRTPFLHEKRFFLLYPHLMELYSIHNIRASRRAVATRLRNFMPFCSIKPLLYRCLSDKAGGRQFPGSRCLRAYWRMSSRLIGDIDDRAFAVLSVGKKKKQILLGMNGTDASLLLHNLLMAASVYDLEFLRNHAAGFQAVGNSHWSSVVGRTQKLFALHQHRATCLRPHWERVEAI